MSRRTGARSVGTLVLSVLLATLAAGSVPVAGHDLLPPAAAPPERSADLARTLSTDGTFHGVPGVAGSVDTSGWTLVSNLAAGEPPRFAPATTVSPSSSATGPWSAMGSNAGNGAINGGVYTLAVSGSDLYVGGDFTNAAHIATADYIARWNGSAWSALGSNGHGNGALNHWVDAVAVSGSDLYVGGGFTNAAGIPRADRVAKWDGSAWSALGSNGSGNGAINGSVFALAVSGTSLYVGGSLTDAAGIPEADYVATWDGNAWSALGSNAGNGALNGVVYALAVSGNDLYVGGGFWDAAGIPEADRIAKWNGSAWSALGSNGSGDGAIEGNDRWVEALAVSGSDLYVGGDFTDAAGIPEADNIAKWHTSGAAVHQPEARIRLGTGAYVGNNIYNTTGSGQKRSGSAAPGHSLTFGISIQNDGTASDRFTVQATGTTVSGYRVKYLSGTTDITASVVAGTYRTASLAPGARVLVTAKVTVKSAAARHSPLCQHEVRHPYLHKS